MASIKPYNAVGLILTVRGIRQRADIRVNLEHLKHLVKAAAWLSSLDLPVRLIAIPEGALQGFNDEVLDLDHAQFAREGANPTARPIPPERLTIARRFHRVLDCVGELVVPICGRHYRLNIWQWCKIPFKILVVTPSCAPSPVTKMRHGDRRSEKQEQNNASDASNNIRLLWILSPELINLSQQSLFPSNHRLLGKLGQQERPGTERPSLWEC